MTDKTADRVVVICFWISLALTIGAALNWAHTGHLPAGIFITGGTTAAVAFGYLRRHIP